MAARGLSNGIDGDIGQAWPANGPVALERSAPVKNGNKGEGDLVRRGADAGTPACSGVRACEIADLASALPPCAKSTPRPGEGDIGKVNGRDPAAGENGAALVGFGERNT